MKKSLLAITLAGLLFSCKKESTTEFTPTDVTGTTTVKGICTKNIITPNGFGWSNTEKVPAEGVTVQIKVNKNALYPNSNAQGADVYSAVTNAKGEWTINVKTNATGVNANVTFASYTGTLDTLNNGVVKKGADAYFVPSSTNGSSFLQMGSTVNYPNVNLTGSALAPNSSNLVIGSAIVTGSVGIQQEVLRKYGSNGNALLYDYRNTPVPAGTKVYLEIIDPSTLKTKKYTATTDANGNYSFTVVTADRSSNFNSNCKVWVEDYATTNDKIVEEYSATSPFTLVKTTTEKGSAGVYSMSDLYLGSIFNNEIKNANNITYYYFTQN